ncbi:uncharacterized protein ACA1_271560 [Acanthamoeba castellanii str. Neff]|uniref:Uncharacterized protein n=1 Tax=Acanthamoeba castellanii (strain ATCC 30010 / Neff) TaxID=1257118 RepID=L8GR73_ACACF|nr:uncharacterized protein ACA1_271560 [Acanthamoeba castellanii str. Neff]ELR14611.1 hypothetical protein ACA1_271560 [Acanthamoeba castellanii str. Neff]
MYHHAAAGVATLPSGRHSFPLDGGGGCAVGGEDEIDCRHHGGGRGEGRPGLGPHHRLDGQDGPNGDADLYHRLVVHPRPLAQRLDVSIELAQPCRETVTENGVTKEVHVIVKQVPFSIHVRLPAPPLKAPKRECRLSERRCGKVRSDGDDDYHDHHHHHHDASSSLSPTAPGTMVTDLRGLEMEVRLRYDGEGGRAVPFVQRPPLDVIATRVADDGRSAVLTARVRALSSQHQNRLFVAHVRAFTPPPSPEASADQSPATTSSLPPSGAPSPATGLEPASMASVVLEALTEPIQVISKPRSSRKRVVRRKRTLGDMLLECTQRIERAQLAHAHAIGALSKRCRLVPRDNDGTDTAPAAPAQQLLHHYEPHAPPPQHHQQSQQQQQQQVGDGNAFLVSPLEDPQLMMLMDLPAAFPHSFLPASFVPGPEQHQHQQQLQLQHQQFNPPYHQQQHHHQQQQADVKEMPAFFPAPTLQTQRPQPAADDPLSPPLPGSSASPCSPACASSSSSAHHHHSHQQQPHHQQQQLQHLRDPRLRTPHAAAGPVASASSQGASPVAPASEEDPVEAAAGAFLRSYAALPSFDRSMAIRRVLRKYGTDRLQALGSLLALLASRTPPPPKRAQNPNEAAASFQSCVCTSCSYEAELHNIDGFYKDFINLEFSFQ